MPTPVLQSLSRTVARSYLELRVRIDQAAAGRLNYNHLAIRLAGSYPEQPAVRAPYPFRRAASPTLLQLLALLSEIEHDPRLETVLIRIDGLSLGWAKLQTISRALDRIRAAGKKTVAYLERCSTGQYALAASCDRIILPPSATLNLVGLQADVLFARELLDKLGLKPEFESAGKYKSAMETFTRKEISKSARENLDAMLDSIYDEVVKRIADRRGLHPTKVIEAIDDGPHLPDKAKKLGLIDEALYRHQIRDYLKQDAKPTAVRADLFAAMASRRKALRAIRSPQQRIGLLVADGMIVAGRSQNPAGDQGTVTSGTMRRSLTTLRKDKSVKAVVLRVNSPGGDALASDLIHQELLRLAESKPLVVSMGDTAASGGYYIGMAGDPVFVEPSTLTGSIGVISGKMTAGGLMAKVGVRQTSFTRGENADLYSPGRPFSESGRKKLKEQINAFYKTFVAKVAEARKMKPAAAGKVAQGRVWTGTQAIECGLADRIGGLAEAIAEAMDRAGMPADAEPTIVALPKPRPWWRMRSDGLIGRLRSAAFPLPADWTDDLTDAAALAAALGDGAPAALLTMRIRFR